MADDETFPRLVLPDWFGERQMVEMTWKGRLCVGIVELATGRRYAMCFIDATRLRQELDDQSDIGQPWIAEPNMVVLVQVTLEAIRSAIQALEREGYFEKLGAMPRLVADVNKPPEQAA